MRVQIIYGLRTIRVQILLLEVATRKIAWTKGEN